MKAFVIKNKEGKYLQYFTDMYRFDFTDKLINAMFYEQWEQDSINYALKTIPDCDEVVEITIAEGDLEQENKQLKEQLAEKELEAIRWEEHFNNAKIDYQCLEEDKNKEIAELREQLAEKDKEIDKLTRRLNLTTKYKDDQKERANKYYDEIKQIRKQVCETIRQSFDEHRKILKSNYDECIFSMDDIIEELEEIEQAKENLK